LAAGSIGCHSTTPDSGIERGEVLYGACISCHKDNGSGHPGIGAPSIAGMTPWYVERQLNKFRHGIRGNHHEDIEGMRMRPMSRTLRHESDVQAVAEYVASMPRVEPAHSLGGDAKAGQALYAVCQACHGAKAEGNIAMNAPQLAHHDDWYLLNQLKKFKAGIRGSNPQDITGAQMMPMASTLIDEQAMKNVIAYIQTLK
jgi:cytochrome c oxidase subunit 2